MATCGEDKVIKLWDLSLELQSVPVRLNWLYGFAAFAPLRPVIVWEAAVRVAKGTCCPGLV